MSQGANPLEREFLGRKIFSVPLPSIPLPLVESSRPAPPPRPELRGQRGLRRLLHFAGPARGVFAQQRKPGPDASRNSGLIEAAKRSAAPAPGLFGYENRVETTRAMFEALKASSSAAPHPAARPIR